jgi:chromate transport protein ChrA
MRMLLALLLGSAIVGFLIGLKYRVLVLVLTGPVIAVVVAIAVRDFHFVPAVVTVFASLLLSQIGYLIGAWLRTRSTNQQSYDRIDRDC